MVSLTFPSCARASLSVGRDASYPAIVTMTDLRIRLAVYEGNRLQPQKHETVARALWSSAMPPRTFSVGERGRLVNKESQAGKPKLGQRV